MENERCNLIVYTGKGSYIYIKTEGSTFGFSAAAIGASGHIPVNPCLDLSNLPEPKYREKIIKTMDSEHALLIYTELMEKGTADLEFIFKDIFLMAMAFHYKVVDTPWTGTDDDITMDFTAITHRESFMLHIHIDHATDPVDITFYGCQIEAYKWVVTPGELMKEVVTISCINAKEDVQVMVCANGFHDQRWGSAVGGWGNWDSDAPYHASQCTPTIGGAITSIALQSYSIGFEYPKKTEHTTDSMIALNVNYDDFPVYFFEVEGPMLTDAELVEIRKTFANKTTNQTIKVTFGDATKYMQFINGYLKTCDNVKIPDSATVYKHKIRYEGGVNTALNVALRYSIATDPDPMITN